MSGCGRTATHRPKPNPSPFQSARGLAHSKTLRAIRASPANAPASWTAAALRRFHMASRPIVQRKMILARRSSPAPSARHICRIKTKKTKSLTCLRHPLPSDGRGTKPRRGGIVLADGHHVATTELDSFTMPFLQRCQSYGLRRLRVLRATKNSNARPVVSIKRTFCLNNSSGHGLFPQFRFQNFPRRIFRQRGPDDDLFRHFVVSQLAADEFVQRLFVERLTFRRCDERHGLLAAPRVRHADDLCLAPVLSSGLMPNQSS